MSSHTWQVSNLPLFLSSYGSHVRASESLDLQTHHIANTWLPIRSELSRVSSVPPLPGKVSESYHGQVHYLRVVHSSEI